MAKIADTDVKKAIAEMTQLTAGGSALRPDQVERIKAAYAEPDIGVRARKVEQLLDELRRQFEDNSRRLEGMQQELGLDSERIGRFRHSDRLSETARAELDAALGGLAAQSEREVKDAARQAARPTTGAARPRPGRLSV